MRIKRGKYTRLSKYEEMCGWRKVNFKEFDGLGITIARKGRANKCDYKIVSKEYIPKDGEVIIKRMPDFYYIRKKGKIIEFVSKIIGRKIRRFKYGENKRRT